MTNDLLGQDRVVDLGTQQSSHMPGVGVTFIGAVVTMGAPLWARIQAIFTWEADIVLPERTRRAS